MTSHNQSRSLVGRVLDPTFHRPRKRRVEDPTYLARLIVGSEREPSGYFL